MSEEMQKQKLIEEIHRRIKYLISTTEISDEEKVGIASNALNILECGDLTKEKSEELV